MLVTGGAAGIGRETVRQFAGAGARVVSMDWDGAANRETAAEVCADGGDCQAIEGDVSVAGDVERAFEAAGPVDVLVNNAGFWKDDGFLLEVTEEAWEKVLAVCLKGVFLCSKAALATMVKRGSGAIVNISSVNALAGIHLAAYTAAKGGVISLARLMAAQYGPRGVRVNTICPGTIMTESSRAYYDAHPALEADLRALYPGGEFGKPRDIAATALFLASDAASFINGAVINVDGGLMAVRRLPGATPRDPA